MWRFRAKVAVLKGQGRQKLVAIRHAKSGDFGSQGGAAKLWRFWAKKWRFWAKIWRFSVKYTLEKVSFQFNQNRAIFTPQKVAIFGLILPKSGDFKATFEWRQKWRFWDPKMAISKIKNWRPWAPLNRSLEIATFGQN